MQKDKLYMSAGMSYKTENAKWWLTNISKWASTCVKKWLLVPKTSVYMDEHSSYMHYTASKGICTSDWSESKAVWIDNIYTQLHTFAQ